ncbi:TonB-dependent receptor plug domain-containing protein [Sphingomonas sp. Tas61C01]|uniref:TonB-dependent receptor plug domain-containing protein n=1 Tax=Sphingomonas sp. Tas61C01 TaxID=3458297 RepID=UPI00403ED94A
MTASSFGQGLNIATRRWALATASGAALAVMLASPAAAQTVQAPTTTPGTSAAAEPVAPTSTATVDTQTDDDIAAVRDIIVTGSRITANGFSAPTPTQVIGAADIDRLAQPNVFNAVTQLPSLQGSTGRATSVGSTSSGIQGLSSFSLRGLGAIRTLTLLDGQRFVGANYSGVADVSQFPQLLIQRVDVVNGGASASYGSDAVAGVVNFITDKRFKGFKANVQGSITTYGDDAGGTAQVAWGNSFAQDRLHVVVSGEYGYQGGVPNPGFGVVGANGRDWFTSPAFVQTGVTNTPAGQPRIKYVDRAQQYQYAKFGLITSGPLQGTAFGANGQPYQFQYGSNGVPTGTGGVTGCTPSFCSGGDTSGVVGAGTTLAGKLERFNGYGRVGYDFAPDNEIYATFNASRVKAENSPNPGFAQQANLTIQCGLANLNANPFVPASIQQGCTNAGITQFQYGSALAQLGDFIKVRPVRTNLRGVIGATGKFASLGSTWTYDAYYEYGHNYTDLHVSNMLNISRFRTAYQAVRLPNGTIACANVAARAAGCVPLNIIGDGGVTEASLNYVKPAIGPYQHTWSSQNAAAVNLNGQPMQTWAGPLSVAFGYEFRREWYRTKADPYGNGVTAANPNTADYPADPTQNTLTGGNWYAGNYKNGTGRYNVHEGFLELDIPISNAEQIGRANINAGVRQTHYSTSGWITSWKVGGTWDTPLTGIRLRAITSRDVRAPNLSELFRTPTFANATYLDTRPPGASPSAGQFVQAPTNTIGNTALKPETSRNTTGGIVFDGSEAGFLPGFNASVDYYNIKVKGIIIPFSGQAAINQCFQQKIDEFCSSFNLDTAAGSLFVNEQLFNFSQVRTNGFDIEASYRRPLSGIGLPGSFMIRGLATRVLHYTETSGLPGTIPTEQAGNNRGNTPDWKLLGIQSWDTDDFSLSVTERWFSNGVYSNEYIECTPGSCPATDPTGNTSTIGDNSMPGAFYVDVGGSVDFSKQISIYFKIDNVANKAPEQSPQNGVSYGFNPVLYDVLGRTFRLGARLSF